MSNPEGKPLPARRPGKEEAPMECQGRILAVDDNEDIINIIQRFLTRQNYQILVARNGREGLEIARREMPDLILLDIMLPEMDGLSVCRELKQNPKTRGIMILLVTGRGAVDHRAEGLDAGADDYIPKPFHITELLARVRSSLRIKRLNDELRERNRELQDSQRERLRAEKMATIGLLASGIAHEFNNIMSGISGYAQLAQKNPKFRDRLVEIALIQSERAQELTRSLSSFYRPSPGKRATTLESVLENSLCLVAKEVEERHITVERHLAEARPVMCSPGQLQEVVLNLVINAIHAIGSNGKIDIFLRETGEDQVELSIQDNGCGIPPENMDRIFDAFFTTKGPLGGGETCGSGLGLSVSYNILRSHGGSIRVQSEPGKGTAFAVTLPAVDPSSACSDENAGRAAFTRRGQFQERTGREEKGSEKGLFDSVLVVDTEEAVREMVCQCLNANEVIGVEDWSEALEQLRKRPFDFVILDIEVPGAPKSEDCLKAIRQINADAMVIITSRRYRAGDFERELTVPINSLLKPYNIENLTEVMSRLQAVPTL